MRDDRFEWDDRKAAANVRKHAISIEDARVVFDAPGYADRIDEDEHGEGRWLTTGLVSDVLITVCHAEYGRRGRIISAGKANRDEIETCTRQNRQ